VSKTISDIIEEFIMNSLDDGQFIELSRNDLAKFFSCVPSQINYVLNTRFTLNRGFVVESQRGGGGYVKVLRVSDNNNNFINNVLNRCLQPLTLLEANQIISQMQERKIVTPTEANIIKAAVSAKALNNPINMDNTLRATILKQIIIEIIKGKGE